MHNNFAVCEIREYILSRSCHSPLKNGGSSPNNIKQKQNWTHNPSGKLKTEDPMQGRCVTYKIHKYDTQNECKLFLSDSDF